MSDLAAVLYIAAVAEAYRDRGGRSPSHSNPQGSAPMPFERPSQRGILSLSIDDLTRLLGLPDGHRIERITATEYPFAPGVLVTVSGLAMSIAPANSPLMVEPWDRFAPDIERRIAAAVDHLRRAEREHDHAG